MTDFAPTVSITPRLSEAEIERLRSYGEEVAAAPGARLFSDGDRRIPFLVILDGEVDVRTSGHRDDQLIRRMGPGEFIGDSATITGQGAVAYAEAVSPARLLSVPHERFQRLLVEDSQLSDLIVSTFVARRAFLREEAPAGIAVVGRRYDRHAFEIRELLTKNNVPHAWVDADDDADTRAILAAAGAGREDLPAVLDGRGVLTRPSLCAVVERYGLSLLADVEETDVIVVGAGPAGLASSVYAGSEGLGVVALDGSGPGGQAGTSSKIENYLGFPTGVSGHELAERAAVQAQKFGARVAAPAQARSLERDGDGFRVELFDGRSVRGRAVVIATGAAYRRLPIEGLERFEGSGVFYGATPMEAQLCGGQEVAVVGAGNSAGQGAVFLAQTAKAVHVLYRRADIRETMSEYLVRRLEETPNVHLHPRSEITALHGCEARLRQVAIARGEERVTQDLSFVFLFIGAAPCTDWLPKEIALDDKGFVKTGAALSAGELVRGGWTLDRMPTTYETSWPRVYAVGDVRAGSIKRVASAVGEGSVVVASVHAALAEAKALEAA